MRGRLRLGKRVAPPRFILFLVLLVVGALGWRLVVRPDGWAEPLAMGFDLAALAFVGSLWPLVRESDAGAMRRHSAENDANRIWVLGITTVLTVVVMAAIAGELPQASAGSTLAMVRLIGTLALTWTFANSVYALHYAHFYYSTGGEDGADAGGLDFPGTKTPDYLDFAYFAFTLGMTFQTSDVEITARPVRRVATLHSFAAFVFNIGVIAFTINALGGS
ncbi:DUF1345 domain-containing protein [Novosphingobium huizhouense]|uniref:DUF1345 domain-containing protein n=1 Tax=Novosphingobium huizhouense TaxID=2866625 RepID=UPI001CD88027|nr:DUF1345 domain-containing protein [Novosphingobium huizhouense]